MNHPLSLCNFFGCTAETLFKYVIAPFGEHHCEGIVFYDENYFSPLNDIVDTNSNWELEFISKKNPGYQNERFSKLNSVIETQELFSILSSQENRLEILENYINQTT